MHQAVVLSTAQADGEEMTATVGGFSAMNVGSVECTSSIVGATT